MWGWVKHIKLIRKKEDEKGEKLFSAKGQIAPLSSIIMISSPPIQRGEICTQDSSSLPSDISFGLPKRNPSYKIGDAKESPRK